MGGRKDDLHVLDAGNRGDVLALTTSSSQGQDPTPVTPMLTQGKSDIVLSGNVGNVHVASGVTAYLNYGATASDIRIDRGGVLVVEDGWGDEPIVSGTITVAGLLDASDGKISDDRKFKVVWDLSGGYVSNSPMIVNMEHVASMHFSISVAADQTPGTYCLADGLEDLPKNFRFPISILNGASGSLTVGKTVKLGSRKYTLALENTRLYLTVAGQGSPAPAPQDTTPPDAPIAWADTTDPTTKKVTVKAGFSEDSAKRQYSTNNSTWKTYNKKTGVVMTSNGTVYFRGIDAAGNISEVTSYTVTNIGKSAVDTNPPEAPYPWADITAPTSKKVTVKAGFSEDSAKRQYSTNNSTWKTYNKKTGVVMTSNGTVYFRGIDAAGNISEVTSYTVTNIDKSAPDVPVPELDTTPPDTPKVWAKVTAEGAESVTVTAIFSSDSAQKQYSSDNLTWSAYTSSLVMTVGETAYFRGIDDAGNISEVASYTVTNIDDALPPDTYVFIGEENGSQVVDLTNSGKYYLLGLFEAGNGSVTVYNGGRKVASGTIRKGELKFNNDRPVLLDSGLSTEVSVKTRNGKYAGYAAALVAEMIYNRGDNDSPRAPREFGSVAAGQELISDGWVGFGDAQDYATFTLDDAAMLSLSFSASDATRFTVYSAATGKAVMRSSLKAGAELTTRAKPLQAGDYLVVAESTNAKKGGSSDYTLAVGADTTFFTRGDNSDDSRETAVNKGALVTGARLAKGWVGLGDAVDYTRFTLDGAGKLMLALTATDATKITLLDGTGKSVLKAEVKAKGSAVSGLRKLKAGEYFLAVESTNAKQGGDSDYKVDVATLEMEEVRSFATAGALTLFDDAGFGGAAGFDASLLQTAGVENDAFGLAQGTAPSLEQKEEKQVIGSLALK